MREIRKSEKPKFLTSRELGFLCMMSVFSVLFCDFSQDDINDVETYILILEVEVEKC